MNLFQSIVLAIFALFAVTAVIIFSMQSSGGGQLNFAGTFTVWGTFPEQSVSRAEKAFNDENKKFYNIKYVEKSKQTFQGDLVSALAAGNGPDLIILPESLVVQNIDKTIPIAYSDYSARNFSDGFIDGSSIFTNDQGILGIPLLVAGKLTLSDRGGSISQAAVALGSYSNVDHAKDILSALLLQAGNDIVTFKSSSAYDLVDTKWPLSILLGQHDSGAAESSLNFFLDFTNPSKKSYSWNVAMPISDSAFSGGSLAIFFGHASDFGLIKKSNPHLNFGVAEFPQRNINNKKLTFGNFYAVAVTKGTTKISAAKQVAISMSTSDFVKLLSEDVYLPPARRDLLTLGSLDPAMSVFYSSAIISKSWLDPSPPETDQIFQEMIESVLSGVKKPSEAISVAGEKLGNLIKS
ncbi:MAG: hypothetical protein HY225_00700 [Candidatus Vogelbacteria bacterium]|nr:hypothetical protein [Candidatus Vogelbacteria bacterium]